METSIRGIDEITAAQALQAIRAASPNDVRPADTALYVPELVALCRQFRVRHTVLLAQAWHETGGFGPAGRWRELNPAGLGITSGGDQTPYRLIDGAEAARLHVWSMLIALREWDNAERVTLPPAAAAWVTRWTSKYRDPACPIVANVEDLNHIYSGNRATWATDSQYDSKLLSALKRLFPTSGESEKLVSVLVFGRVPHPLFHDRPITKPEGRGQNNLGKRSVKGVTWHRMLGSLDGTDGHFRNPSVGALTDYGVGVQAQDGKALAGVIYRWNDPLSFQSGWASGTYSRFADGDGAAFVAKYGVDAINRDRASVEVSGFQGTKLDEDARQAIAAITAHWADQYGIPWDQFPIAPQDGFSFVCWHEEFGPDNGQKKCPFEVVKAETAELIERTRQIMRRYQTTATGNAPETPDGSVFAAPLTYPWLVRDVADEGVDRKIERTTVYYFPGVYTAIEKVPRLRHAGQGSPEIGPPIEPGTKFRADYVFRSRGVSFVLTPYGTRVRAASLLPKIQISTRGTISVRRTLESPPEIGRRHVG